MVISGGWDRKKVNKHVTSKMQKTRGLEARGLVMQGRLDVCDQSARGSPSSNEMRAWARFMAGM
jgi:hypothetical protein